MIETGYGVEWARAGVSSATTGTSLFSPLVNYRRDCAGFMVNVDTLTGGYVKIGGGVSGSDPVWFYTEKTGVFQMPLEFPGLRGTKDLGASVAVSGTCLVDVRLGTYLVKVTSE